ncbi:lipopolysaccharide biosynthesis protein [Cryobacterium lyxosi]|uniref:Lipopolysaccharide biosynthesis protein n=1 Tax=Cryobacterium lyxosi TaxID=1259228 RepID=A0A4R8ZIT8_9MICO|nr:lipopolysaccharide biosynthesis protein [Cryobacterium lyxosi]TFD29192.1 lipopolysaccharide biosynthesis protein [Cryobacterium lyxosi]
MNRLTFGNGVLMLLGGQWAKYLIQIASLVVLSRLLSTTDFGLIAMVTAVVGVASVIGDFGLSLAALQAFNLSSLQKSNLFWLNTALGVITGICVALLALPLANFYDRPEIAGLTLLIATTFPLNGIAVQFRTELNRRLEFRTLALSDVFGQAAGLAIAVIAALLDYEYWALGIQTVAGSLVSLLIVAIASKWIPGWPNRQGNIGGLLRFGGSTLATQMVKYASSNVDSVLIGRTHGAAILGIYDRAFQLVSLPVHQLAAPLTRVVLPYLSRLSPGTLDVPLQKIQLGLAYGLVCVLSILASASEPLITIILGSKWAAAAPILEILALGSLFQALGYIYYWLFLSIAKTAYLFWSELFGRGLMIVLMVMFVPYGPEWVALSSSIGLFVIWIFGTIFAVPRTGVRVTPLLSIAARPVGLFVTSYAVCKLLRTLYLDSSGVSPMVQLLVLAGAWFIWTTLAVILFRKLRQDVAYLVTMVVSMAGNRRTGKVDPTT